jgi:hypothetical protein
MTDTANQPEKLSLDERLAAVPSHREAIQQMADAVPVTEHGDDVNAAIADDLHALVSDAANAGKEALHAGGRLALATGVAVAVGAATVPEAISAVVSPEAVEAAPSEAPNAQKSYYIQEFFRAGNAVFNGDTARGLEPLNDLSTRTKDKFDFIIAAQQLKANGMSPADWDAFWTTEPNSRAPIWGPTGMNPATKAGGWTAITGVAGKVAFRQGIIDNISNAIGYQNSSDLNTLASSNPDLLQNLEAFTNNPSTNDFLYFAYMARKNAGFLRAMGGESGLQNIYGIVAGAVAEAKLAPIREWAQNGQNLSRSVGIYTLDEIFDDGERGMAFYNQTKQLRDIILQNEDYVAQLLQRDQYRGFGNVLRTSGWSDIPSTAPVAVETNLTADLGVVLQREIREFERRIILPQYQNAADQQFEQFLQNMTRATAHLNPSQASQTDFFQLLTDPATPANSWNAANAACNNIINVSNSIDAIGALQFDTVFGTMANRLNGNFVSNQTVRNLLNNNTIAPANRLHGNNMYTGIKHVVNQCRSSGVAIVDDVIQTAEAERAFPGVQLVQEDIVRGNQSEVAVAGIPAAGDPRTPEQIASGRYTTAEGERARSRANVTGRAA